MFRARILTAALALCPAAALAAGFEVPENGALPLARGGTSSGLLDTAYAVSFNPAGLSLIDGLDVRLDYRFVNHAVTFTRGQEDDFATVSNTAGVFAAPFIAVAYGADFMGGRIGAGLGIFGPPGVGRYKYPEPAEFADAEGGSDEIDYNTGHRYATLGTNTQILYPSIALSYAPLRTLSFGFTFQPTVVDISLRQALGGFPNQEHSNEDVLVGIHVKDSFSPTAIAGAIWEPAKNWLVHASFRPKVSIHAEGPLDLAAGATIKPLVKFSGNKTTTLDIALPPIGRLGAAFEHRLFTASAELIYEGWSVNQQFVLTPDVLVDQGKGPEGLDPVTIEKEWKDSFGARVGGTYKALRPAAEGDFFVDVHAGGLFETNAIPAERQSLDYVTGDRIGGSLGFTVGYKGFALTAAGMGYVPVRMEITNSEVTRATAIPDDPPIIVGNGVYTSNVWLASVGLSYTGLGSAK